MDPEDYKHLDLPTLEDLAHRDTRGLSRVYAIEELARRAVQDQALLPAAVAAVSGGRSWERPQGGAPIGHHGRAGDARQDAITEAMVEAMRARGLPRSWRICCAGGTGPPELSFTGGYAASWARLPPGQGRRRAATIQSIANNSASPSPPAAYGAPVPRIVPCAARPSAPRAPAP